MYIIPESVEDIKTKLNGRDVYYLAGGTDIMVLKKENMLADKPWVDISQLQELKGISKDDYYINIGALSTMTEIAQSPLIREYAEALSDAALAMGSPLIRNLATIGGNIANSNPAGDTLPAVYALDAILEVQNGNEKKEIPVNEFCLDPCENVLKSGQIITKIMIPIQEGNKSAFLKLGPRSTLAIAKVSVAACWLVKEEEIVDIRIAMGAVGPKCLMAKKTEELLKGKKLTPEILEKASETIQHEACPIDDFRSTKEYRSRMTGVLLERILKL